MQLDDYLAIVNDPRQRHGLFGPCGAPAAYRISAPPRPAQTPPARRASSSAATRSQTISGPARPRTCRICHAAALLDARLRCEACAAEIRWQSNLAKQGLKVVW
jgi:hypothetical protein